MCVCVMDNGNLFLSSEVRLLIILKNINDRLCDFELFSSIVKENVIIGLKIGCFVVVDEDVF